MSVERLKAAIRDVPDFPKDGIIFKDITPILSDPDLFKLAVDTLADRHANSGIDKVCVVEARGFIFGSAIAYKLGVGVIPIRKKGKLPYDTNEATYDLEYGTATLQIHTDALEKGARVLSPKGQEWTPQNIGSALATRNLMTDLRSAGETTSGPAVRRLARGRDEARQRAAGRMRPERRKVVDRSSRHEARVRGCRPL